MVLFLLLAIAILVLLYRNYKGENVGKFITEQVQVVYDKFAPYSFKVVREKTKELGQEYTARQYTIQVVIFGAFAAIVSYLYFYSLMIELAYQNGSIDESLEYMNNLYPYYIVKNMHQLFLQITKEGAQNYMDSLDNMQLDIDMLVESVYRDRMERATFHKSFLQFGIMLYVMVMLVQYLLGKESYIELLNTWYVTFLLHAILLIWNLLLQN